MQSWFLLSWFYSCENSVCGVTESISTPCMQAEKYRPRNGWPRSSSIGVVDSIPTAARQIFQLARCGYTFGVTLNYMQSSTSSYRFRNLFIRPVKSCPVQPKCPVHVLYCAVCGKHGSWYLLMLPIFGNYLIGNYLK